MNFQNTIAMENNNNTITGDLTPDVPKVADSKAIGKKLADDLLERTYEGQKQGIYERPEYEALDIFDDKYQVVEAYKVVKLFKENGFMRISRSGDDNLSIIKTENKVLEPFNWRTDTLSFICSLEKNEHKRPYIESMAVKYEQTILKCWKLLGGVPYDLNRDTKDSIYIPFKNCVAKVTASGIEAVDYSSDEIKFFSKVESLNHEYIPFDIKDRETGIFEKFLIYAVIGRSDIDIKPISEGEREQINAFYSMVGYLISNFKDPTQSPAITLSDAGADDQMRNGGRGKSLLTKAISMVRKDKFRGGREFDPSYRHNFSDLEPYHDLYILDDVPAGFNYDSLYTNISGDITAERKGTSPVTIPFADAPKFVITTNWAVRYDKEATSTNRRFSEYKFSDFWNINNTPDQFFGCTFFYDWGVIEWERFFQFLIYCSQYYLKNGIQKIEYDKDSDNYRAIFHNDAKLEMFDSVFQYMLSGTEFSVMDFVKKYDELYPYGKVFNHINTKNHIDVYIEYHKLNIEYKQRSRKWHLTENNSFEVEHDNNDDDETSQLPF